MEYNYETSSINIKESTVKTVRCFENKKELEEFKKYLASSFSMYNHQLLDKINKQEKKELEEAKKLGLKKTIKVKAIM